MNQSKRETRRRASRLFTNVYLIVGSLYLIFGNYAIPFAFAQRQASALPDTPAVRPSPLPRVRPTPVPRPQPPSPTASPTATSTITPTATPAAPEAQPATYVGANSFTANWSNVAGANGYRLDVATDSSFTMFVPGYQN